MISQLLLVRVDARRKELIEGFEEKLLFRLDTDGLRVRSVKELHE